VLLCVRLSASHFAERNGFVQIFALEVSLLTPMFQSLRGSSFLKTSAMLPKTSLIHLFIILVACMAIGCGDHDDPSGAAAATTVSDPKGKSFNLVFADGSTGVLTFSEGGAYALNTVPSTAGGATTTETGAYTFSSSSNTQGELILRPSAGGAAGVAQTRIVLTYANAGSTSGSFTSNSSTASGEQVGTSNGTFSLRTGLGSAISAG
jgi:hypothetical protein